MPYVVVYTDDRAFGWLHDYLHNAHRELSEHGHLKGGGG